MAAENERIQGLRDRLWAGLSHIPDIFLNGDLGRRVPHNLNLSFSHIEGEALIMGLKGLAVSSGSDCTSASLETSHVLRALGRTADLSHSTLPLSWRCLTTFHDIPFTIHPITHK